MIKKGIKAKNSVNRKKNSLTTQSTTHQEIKDNNQKAVEFILNSQNSSNTNTKSSSLTRKLLVIIAILAAFIALISLGNYSGNVIAGEKFLFTKTADLDIPYKVIDIKKDANSAVLINYKSDINTNIFAEIEDCNNWKDSKDNNNYVLYAVSNIRDANFKLGDVLQKTRQQIDFYKTSNLCLILVDKESPRTGKFTVTVKETDKNIYNVIE